jgi:hypothetical protein
MSGPTVRSVESGGGNHASLVKMLFALGLSIEYRWLRERAMSHPVVSMQWPMFRRSRRPLSPSELLTLRSGA